MILGVNGRFLGAPATGVQRFAREIVRRLWARSRGGVLLLPRDVPPPTDLPDGVRAVAGSLTGQRWERIELPRLARASGCDVVFHPANTLPRVGGPHVVVVHDVEPLVHPAGFSVPFRLWYRWGIAPAVRRAAAVVTVSEASAEAIARTVGVDRSAIRVADQGASPFDQPVADDEVAAARRRLALAGPYLLAVGDGDPRKNVDFLRAVIAHWRARRDRGEALPAPPALVSIRGGARHVFARSRGDPRGAVSGELRLERVDDRTLHALYSGAVALTFPSRSEGFGRPPLEALACGTPALVAPYPAAAEVLGDAAEQLPLEPDVWVDAVVRLLTESPEAAALRSERGRARAARHSWDAGAEAVWEACQGSARGVWASPSRRPEAAARSSGWPAARPAPVPRGERARRPAADPLGYPDLRVALVHDWLTGMRGGERVLEELLALFPRADVFTLLHVPGSVSPAIEARRITTTFVQQLPGAATRYRWYLPLFPRAIGSLDFTGYDLVVSSSHCVAKGARAAHGAPHLCYCHTPMRYVWDQFDAYFGPGRASPPVRAAAAAFAPSLRRWDRASARLVDRFVANSEHVRERIGRLYGRDASVVHPPVNVERFRAAPRREGFYLIVSALVPYKRVELAVEAFGRLDRSLVVVGSGPELPRLRAQAGPRTRFTGWIADDDIADLMGRCRALVMPGVEDFGIVPVEAQAAGAPVIALGDGGALETVVEGEGGDATGVFFRQATVDALTQAVAAFERRTFDPAAARRSALRFTRERFLEAMHAEVAAVLGGARAPRGALAGVGETR